MSSKKYAISDDEIFFQLNLLFILAVTTLYGEFFELLLFLE